MPVAWFICPYVHDYTASPYRYPAMDQFTWDIKIVEGGDWSETEVLGDRCIVKVRAPDVLLNTIAGTAGIRRLPKVQLIDGLGDLGPAAKQALVNELLDAGYLQSEIDTAFPLDLGNYTMGDVLEFLATRRSESRWTGIAIVLDGPDRPCKAVTKVDSEVSNT